MSGRHIDWDAQYDPPDPPEESRWDIFSNIELQALDEFFRSFKDLRPHSQDIQQLAAEAAKAIAERGIKRFQGTGV